MRRSILAAPLILLSVPGWGLAGEASFALLLKLSCEARTTNGALELEGAISDEVELDLE